jgi:hypothetical protein
MDAEYNVTTRPVCGELDFKRSLGTWAHAARRQKMQQGTTTGNGRWLMYNIWRKKNCRNILYNTVLMKIPTTKVCMRYLRGLMVHRLPLLQPTFEAPSTTRSRVLTALPPHPLVHSIDEYMAPPSVENKMVPFQASSTLFCTCSETKVK